LRNLLTRGSSGFPELAAAQVGFDRPADSFNPAQPTISLYLYDIRERTELRSPAPDVQIVNNQALITPAPMRVARTYLVTAWPGNLTGDELALQEHRLLSQVQAVFWRYPKIPIDFLVGLVAAPGQPLPLITSPAEGLPNPSEFWSALSNRLRPSLNVAVTIAMPAINVTSAPIVTSAEVKIIQNKATIGDFFQIGGQVTNATNAVVSGTVITIAAQGLAATTGDDGRYVLGPLPPGS